MYLEKMRTATGAESEDRRRAVREGKGEGGSRWRLGEKGVGMGIAESERGKMRRRWEWDFHNSL